MKTLLCEIKKTYLGTNFHQLTAESLIALVQFLVLLGERNDSALKFLDHGLLALTRLTGRDAVLLEALLALANLHLFLALSGIGDVGFQVFDGHGECFVLWWSRNGIKEPTYGMVISMFGPRRTLPKQKDVTRRWLPQMKCTASMYVDLRMRKCMYHTVV